MKNLEIRELAKRKNVRLWEIAEKYGLNDGNFSRLLRKELPREQQEKIKEIIIRLAEGRGTR